MLLKNVTTGRLAVLTIISIALARPAAAAISVEGLTARTVYTDSVTFRVVTEAGFTYDAFLNGAPAAVGVPVDVSDPDFYQLEVHRRPSAGGASGSVCRDRPAPAECLRGVQHAARGDTPVEGGQAPDAGEDRAARVHVRPARVLSEQEGRDARDVMLGLAKTCMKTGIPFYHYIGSRLGIAGPEIPPLESLIRPAPA